MGASHAHAHWEHLLDVAEGDLGLVARVGRGPQEQCVEHANAELEARQGHREAGGAARSLQGKRKCFMRNMQSFKRKDKKKGRPLLNAVQSRASWKVFFSEISAACGGSAHLEAELVGNVVVVVAEVPKSEVRNEAKVQATFLLWDCSSGAHRHNSLRGGTGRLRDDGGVAAEKP